MFDQLSNTPQVPNIGDALHICCALGHVELLDYILIQLGEFKLRHLNQPSSLHLRKNAFPLLNLAGCVRPLSYAIAYDHLEVLRHLLQQMTQNTAMLHYTPCQSNHKTIKPSRNYSTSMIEITEAILPDVLELGVRFNAVHCAKQLIMDCNSQIAQCSKLFAGRSQELQLMAAYRGPDMLELFHSLLLPWSGNTLWERMLLHLDIKIPVYPATMRANFDYLKQQILMLGERPEVNSDGNA